MRRTPFVAVDMQIFRPGRPTFCALFTSSEVSPSVVSIVLHAKSPD
jgi:hypothetical protein